MTRLLTRIMTTTIIVSAVSFTAFASPKAGKPHMNGSEQESPMLDKMDANKDGLIQLAEFTAHGDQMFAQIDTDNNGFITDAEKTTFRAEKRKMHAEHKFDKIDINSDGVITKTEFMATHEKRQQHMMERMDMDGDGNVDQADRKAFKQNKRQMMKQHRKEFKAMRKQMHAEHGSRVKPDANGDGMIDIAEHQNALSTLWRSKNQWLKSALFIKN